MLARRGAEGGELIDCDELHVDGWIGWRLGALDAWEVGVLARTLTAGQGELPRVV